MKLLLIIVLCLVLVCGILAAWLYTPDKPEAVLKAQYDDAATSYITVAGITLRVRDTGPRGAPAVILLHGFGSSLDTWDPWARVLSERYRVIRFDLPGFGLTGPDPEQNYSDRRTIEILAALMDRLDLARASLIGNSLGGKIAWNFAVADPDRVDKLVLISPDGFASPGFEYDKKPKLPALLKLLPYTMPRFLLRMNLAVAYADPKKLTDATLTRYRDLMLAPGDRRAMLDRMQQVMLTDPEPALRTIRAPTLILWGEQDGMIPFSNAADYLRDIPGAKLVALPGLGHVPFEEAPAQSLPPVLAFLAADALTSAAAPALTPGQEAQ
jgi:pimeloyl-ACP methyl ester carboxylesterase